MKKGEKQIIKMFDEKKNENRKHEYEEENLTTSQFWQDTWYSG